MNQVRLCVQPLQGNGFVVKMPEAKFEMLRAGDFTIRQSRHYLITPAGFQVQGYAAVKWNKLRPGSSLTALANSGWTNSAS